MIELTVSSGIRALCCAALLGVAALQALGFSFDDPPGPQFSEDAKQAQREAGKQIVPMVAEAFRNGAASVRIPPGDYRFGKAGRNREGVVYPLEFSGLRRTPQTPLTIDASGANFWFDLGEEQAPSAQFCVGFRDCSHIVFHGATIDRGTRGQIEGRITQIDFENNRIEILLSPGITLPENWNGSANQRLLPFKADGRFCAPLYALQKGQRLVYKAPVAGTAQGRVWIPLAHPALLETIRQPEWKTAYGDLGVLTVGDGLSCVYSTAQALSLVDCASLTMRDIKIHVPKGGFNETGGEGGHLWTHCYFGPRQGTSQWQGGDGMMCNATRRGTTLDQVLIEHCTDDPVNIHGYWSEVASVSGNRLELVPGNHTTRLLKSGATPGDRLRFYEKKTGALAGSAKVTGIEGHTVTLDQSAAAFAGKLAEWEDHQCAGWTIRDSEFRDCYQRLLIQSGPGTVSGSRFTRMGSGVQLNSVLSYVEGGVPRGIVIDGNTFEDVNPQPGGAAIHLYARGLQPGAQPWLKDITITNNLFLGDAETVIALKQIDGGLISGNRVERPGPTLSAAGAGARPGPVVVENCRNLDVRGNSVTERK
jgi:hypothetical protein